MLPFVSVTTKLPSVMVITFFTTARSTGKAVQYCGLITATALAIGVPLKLGCCAMISIGNGIAKGGGFFFSFLSRILNVETSDRTMEVFTEIYILS